jgi:hypothetical protein
MGQSEILSNSQIIFITLFSIGGTPLLRLSAITANRDHAERAKTTFLSQTRPHVFDFSSSNFTVQHHHHILSTTGDALRDTLHEEDATTSVSKCCFHPGMNDESFFVMQSSF